MDYLLNKFLLKKDLEFSFVLIEGKNGF